LAFICTPQKKEFIRASISINIFILAIIVTFFSEQDQVPAVKRLSRRNYTQEDVENAFDDFKTSKCRSIRAAAMKYGVPPSTLKDKINGIYHFYIKK